MIRRGRRSRPEGGFTLIELSISIALMGLGFAWIVNMFMGGYRLWKKSFEELILQRNARDSVARIAQQLREAHPGSVTITSPSGKFSEITFTTGRERTWDIRKTGSTIQYVTSYSWGGSTTSFMMSDVETLAFTYPNFQDNGLLEIALTARRVPYQNASPIVVQVVERVLMREP